MTQLIALLDKVNLFFAYFLNLYIDDRVMARGSSRLFK